MTRQTLVGGALVLLFVALCAINRARSGGQAGYSASVTARLGTIGDSLGAVELAEDSLADVIIGTTRSMTALQTDYQALKSLERDPRLAAAWGTYARGIELNRHALLDLASRLSTVLDATQQMRKLTSYVSAAFDSLQAAGPDTALASDLRSRMGTRLALSDSTVGAAILLVGAVKDADTQALIILDEQHRKVRALVSPAAVATDSATSASIHAVDYTLELTEGVKRREAQLDLLATRMGRAVVDLQDAIAAARRTLR